MSTTLSHIGKYRIERELGRGAMGVVYKAFDPVVERMVAIKTIRLDVEDATDLLTRLRREAKSVGQLEHPNVVTLYDAGESAGLFYLAMQFIQGETLQDTMTRQGWFPLREVLEIFRQICAGLDYAHQHGVIHRDIKPANIMVTREGVVKLTDFGIAKVAGTGTTSTGLVVGTPSYMSPEQALGRPLDGRSDIFSLGSILYEMMTGEKAFPGQNVTTVMYKIVHEPPTPLVALQPGLDPSVEAIVLKALAKGPDQRYQTCGELAAELDLYIQRAMTVMPRTSVGSPRPATPAPQAAAAPPTAPLPHWTAAAPASAARTASSVDQVPVAPVAPSVHVPAAPAPITATQPVTRQGLPLAWLGGGVIGTLLLVVVILLIVQMRQPSPASGPAPQPTVETAQPAPKASLDANQPATRTTSPTVETAQPAPQRSLDVTQPPTGTASPAVRPAAGKPQTPPLSAKKVSPPVPTPAPQMPAQPPPNQQAANPLAAPPTSAPAAIQPTITPEPQPTSAPGTNQPTIKPAPEPTRSPPAAKPSPEPEALSPAMQRTFDSFMLQGDLAFQEGEYEQALEHYQKAYRMNSSSRAVRRKLVTVLTLLGRPGEGLKYK